MLRTGSLRWSDRVGARVSQRVSSRTFHCGWIWRKFAQISDGEKIVHLRDISGTQWKSGIAAWLGWFFDGLDMHLYTLVATPFVAQLLMVDVRDDAVREKSSWIQAAFLVGLGVGRRVLRADRRSAGAQPGLDAYDSHVRAVHGAVVLCADVVAPVDLPIFGGAGDWRRMGGGGVAAFGDLAGALAALDGGGAAKRGESRRAAGDAGRVS